MSTALDRIPLGVFSGWGTQPRGDGHSRHYLEFEVVDTDRGLVLIDHDREARSNTEASLLVPVERGYHAALHRLWPFDTSIRLVPRGDAIDVVLRGLGMTGRETLTATLTRGAHRKRIETPDKAASALGAEIDQWLAEREDGTPGQTMTTSVLVEKSGQMRAELYRWGHCETATHLISSCAKSIVGLLTGIALERSGCSADATVDEFLAGPDAQRWGAAGVTLRHVLAMSSGSRWEDSPARSDSAAMLASPSPVAYGLSRAVEVEPGSRYRYDNSLPEVAAAAITSMTGMPYSEFARIALFEPLGIRHHGWTPAGDDVLAAGGLHLRSRDMLALGRLVLDSIAGDGSILPTEWMRATSRSATALGQYAYSNYWHLNTERREHVDGPPAIMALGQGGQTIIAVPSLDLALVTTGLNWNATPVRSTAFALLEAVVLPAMTTR